MSRPDVNKLTFIALQYRGFFSTVKTSTPFSSTEDFTRTTKRINLRRTIPNLLIAEFIHIYCGIFTPCMFWYVCATPSPSLIVDAMQCASVVWIKHGWLTRAFQVSWIITHVPYMVNRLFREQSKVLFTLLLSQLYDQSNIYYKIGQLHVLSLKIKPIRYSKFLLKIQILKACSYSHSFSKARVSPIAKIIS